MSERERRIIIGKCMEFAQEERCIFQMEGLEYEQIKERPSIRQRACKVPF